MSTVSLAMNFPPQDINCKNTTIDSCGFNNADFQMKYPPYSSGFYSFHRATATKSGITYLYYDGSSHPLEIVSNASLLPLTDNKIQPNNWQRFDLPTPGYICGRDHSVSDVELCPYSN
jgi:hypothetical protein